MDIEIPAGMSNAAMLALIIGFIAPLVLNFIVSATWPAWAKAVAAFIFAAITGTLTAWFTGAFDGLSITSTVLLILVISITSYANFWKQVAPNLQRNSAEHNALKEQEKATEIAAVAVPAAVDAAQQVVADVPVVAVDVPPPVDVPPANDAAHEDYTP